MTSKLDLLRDDLIGVMKSHGLDKDPENNRLKDLGSLAPYDHVLEDLEVFLEETVLRWFPLLCLEADPRHAFEEFWRRINLNAETKTD